MISSRETGILVGGPVSPIALSVVPLCSSLPSGNDKEKKKKKLLHFNSSKSS